MPSLTPKIKQILSFYESDCPGTKTNLARILMQGKLGGTGRLLILPVDQGFEHGPGRSFAVNPPAFDPHSHFQLAIDAGLSAFAAPLGLLEAGAATFAGQMPTILKLNSSNSLTPAGTAPCQALTASVKDALRLGCVAVGFTLYPGSDNIFEMAQQFRDIAAEAKSYGLVVVAWSYPRGNLAKAGETALDVVAYSAHMAALLGAHIIKVKLPTSRLEDPAAKKEYLAHNVAIATLQERVSHIVQSCFQGRRLVVFSGGEAKNLEELYQEVRAIHLGGGSGSIIGRNAFRRPKSEALEMLQNIVHIYQEKTSG